MADYTKITEELLKAIGRKAYLDNFKKGVVPDSRRDIPVFYKRVIVRSGEPLDPWENRDFRTYQRGFRDVGDVGAIAHWEIGPEKVEKQLEKDIENETQRKLRKSFLDDENVRRAAEESSHWYDIDFWKSRR